MRGTDVCRIYSRVGKWIIPACAGNSISRTLLPFLCWDHPRVCGEQVHRAEHDGELPGSSPRVRGTVVAGAPEQHLTGIIPACAGNRKAALATRGQDGDHPRVCGEQGTIVIFETGVLGSSPRVRGTGWEYYDVSEQRGIIPACAGNRQDLQPYRRYGRDHPRVCGEQSAETVIFGTFPGSSPRVRGTVPTCAWDNVVSGIIPACAGNSLRIRS